MTELVTRKKYFEWDELCMEAGRSTVVVYIQLDCCIYTAKIGLLCAPTPFLHQACAECCLESAASTSRLHLMDKGLAIESQNLESCCTQPLVKGCVCRLKQPQPDLSAGRQELHRTGKSIQEVYDHIPELTEDCLRELAAVYRCHQSKTSNIHS